MVSYDSYINFTIERNIVDTFHLITQSHSYGIHAMGFNGFLTPIVNQNPPQGMSANYEVSQSNIKKLVNIKSLRS